MTEIRYLTLHRSGPSHTYPKRAYRNPLDQLVTFLDSKHNENWAIWEFRGEGTGYPDELVYNRIRHYPWPDHHPPPFRLVPLIMASMHNWLHGGSLDGTQPATSTEKDPKRVAVVHCKAGKGRSGSMTCSYLISQEGWKAEDALTRFTERRMRPMFGAGVSIPSQVRWISYVDRWAKHGKIYRDRPIEILEIHTWGLRDGVKVEVEGFVQDGKRIEVFHTFKRDERVVVEGNAPGGGGISEMVWDMAGYATGGRADNSETKTDPKIAIEKEETRAQIPQGSSSPHLISPETERTNTGLSQSSTSSRHDQPGGQAVIFRPTKPIKLRNSDVNISVERRNRTHKNIGLTMVSAVAHVWFNVFFEGMGPEQGGKGNDSGVFSIDWEALDGIKGSPRKGTRALDRLSVVWRVEDTNEAADNTANDVVTAPAAGEPIPQVDAADWHGVANGGEPSTSKELGIRVQHEQSADVSRANSYHSTNADEKNNVEEDGELLGEVKSSGPSGEDLTIDKDKQA